MGGAQKWWLHHSLVELSESLIQRGSSLILRNGTPEAIISDIARTIQIDQIHWNQCYTPDVISRDQKFIQFCDQLGIQTNVHKGNLLFDPSDISTLKGEHYSVYTPFWNAIQKLQVEPNKPSPATLPPCPEMVSDNLSDWKLLPQANGWSENFKDWWRAGETAAQERLDLFLDESIDTYHKGRDLPGIDGTSCLSPYLHFGEISVRDVWHKVSLKRELTGLSDGCTTFLKELVWREFCAYLLFHNPRILNQNFRKEFDSFPWVQDSNHLQAWQKGKTGYPIIDAGMRQLWATGWMHNRVRMIVASFLTKNLLIHWRQGEEWFWDTLLDADQASNSANWQWVAGSGADAAPYFRIFNPILQSEKFDAKGDYIRRWVPELSHLSDKHIHAPFSQDPMVLKQGGVTLGQTYPFPIVDLSVTRARALAAYKTLKDV